MTLYASKTASMLRRAVNSARRSFTSPSSAVYQFFASWSSTMPPTGLLLALVPLLHRDELRDGAIGARVAYLVLAASMAVLPVFALRGAPR